MRQLIYNPFSLVIITGIALLAIFSLYQNTERTKASQQSLLKMEDEVSKLEGEVGELANDLELADSPLQKEKILRNELLMQKPGEYVVQIPDELVQEKEQVEAKEKISPWQAWWRLLAN